MRKQVLFFFNGFSLFALILSLHNPAFAAVSLPINEMQGQVQHMVPGELYTVSANYYDSAGRENLRDLNLWITTPTAQDLRVWLRITRHFDPSNPEVPIGVQLIQTYESYSFLGLTSREITAITSPIFGEGYAVTFNFRISERWPASHHGVQIGHLSEIL